MCKKEQQKLKCNTPIADFVRRYAEQKKVRAHMPGHKGVGTLGVEQLDITEVKGADALYEADGIIAESERAAGALFGTGRTLYSAEGSSQCIRAMLYLALMNRKAGIPPLIIAARNVHRSFIHAAALLDFEVKWIWNEASDSLCSAVVTKDVLSAILKNLPKPPAAVYVTSPDYLGEMADIRALSEVCHRYGTLLLVDNAHGTYLHFLEKKMHPMDLGADICADSAHKTLPVLTGGAYLHVRKGLPKAFYEEAKQAMALFGSTSPSYLILQSLDLCNAYLAEKAEAEIKETIWRIGWLSAELSGLGFFVHGGEDSGTQDALPELETVIEKKVGEDFCEEKGCQKGAAEEKREAQRGKGKRLFEPMKLTVEAPFSMTGYELSERLSKEGIECEYADADDVVLMLSPMNEMQDYERILRAFFKVKKRLGTIRKRERLPLPRVQAKACMGIREAMFRKHETLPVRDAIGRIAAAPCVACPPAIPIVVTGEKIDQNALKLFLHYGIEAVEVVKEE